MRNDLKAMGLQTGNTATTEILAWAICIGGIALIIGALYGIVYLTGSMTCESKWSQSGLEHDYKFFGGCMVRRHDGAWVPADTIRNGNQ